MFLTPLQSMPVWLGVAFAALGLAMLLLGAREVWRALRSRAARPVPIRDLSDASGTVVVTGVARRADAVLEAPLTGQECLAYGWRAAESRTVRGLDGSIDTWGQPERGRREAVAFVVDDGTGRILVDAEGATFRLAEERVDDPVADPVATAEPSLRDLIDDLAGVQVHGRQYFESRLDEGETVTVRGRVRDAAGILDGMTLDARRIGVAVGGRGAVVEDGTPGASAGRALRRGLSSAGVGLFVLLVAAVFTLVPGI